MKNIVGIVLGGGKGSRLFPLTMVRSKPAVPLAGKYRLIDVPISNCINSGIRKIFVLTQYNSASLNRHVNLTYRFGLFSEGFVDILAAEQTRDSADWYQGTADAVRQALRHVLAAQVDHILILSGDQLYRMDFAKVLKSHLSRQADITICVLPVETDKASQFGILKMENDGRITEFHEKPGAQEVIGRLRVAPGVLASSGVSHKKPLLASMGIYLFKADLLVELLKDKSKIDFGGHVIPAALSEHRVFGHIFRGYWEDIGTIAAFYKANLDLTSQRAAFEFTRADAPIYTHPRFLPGSRIRRCRITSTILADGCVIEDSTVRGSVIGIRSTIGPRSEVVNSLMMGADFYETGSRQRAIAMGVGRSSSIRNAILDKNARIGKNVRIHNRRQLKNLDADNYYIRDGIVIVPKNVEIPDGTVI